MRLTLLLLLLLLLYNAPSADSAMFTNNNKNPSKQTVVEIPPMNTISQSITESKNIQFSCIDDVNYRSPRVGLSCEQHKSMNCFELTGDDESTNGLYSNDELYYLLKACPVSCSTNCGELSSSWSLSPSAMISNIPSASPSSATWEVEADHRLLLENVPGLMDIKTRDLLKVNIFDLLSSALSDYSSLQSIDIRGQTVITATNKSGSGGGNLRNMRDERNTRSNSLQEGNHHVRKGSGSNSDEYISISVVVNSQALTRQVNNIAFEIKLTQLYETSAFQGGLQSISNFFRDVKVSVMDPPSKTKTPGQNQQPVLDDRNVLDLAVLISVTTIMVVCAIVFIVFGIRYYKRDEYSSKGSTRTNSDNNADLSDYVPKNYATYDRQPHLFAGNNNLAEDIYEQDDELSNIEHIPPMIVVKVNEDSLDETFSHIEDGQDFHDMILSLKEAEERELAELEIPFPAPRDEGVGSNRRDLPPPSHYNTNSSGRSNSQYHNQHSTSPRKFLNSLHHSPQPPLGRKSPTRRAPSLSPYKSQRHKTPSSRNSWNSADQQNFLPAITEQGDTVRRVHSKNIGSRGKNLRVSTQSKQCDASMVSTNLSVISCLTDSPRQSNHKRYISGSPNMAGDKSLSDRKLERSVLEDDGDELVSTSTNPKTIISNHDRLRKRRSFGEFECDKRMFRYTLEAPSNGKLGLVISSSKMGPSVREVKDYSPLFGMIHVGDKILSINQHNTLQMDTHTITQMIDQLRRESQHGEMMRITILSATRKPGLKCDHDQKIKEDTRSCNSDDSLASREHAPESRTTVVEQFDDFHHHHEDDDAQSRISVGSSFHLMSGSILPAE